MASVNIVCTPQGVQIQPHRVKINRVDQNITWNLTGGTWEPDGIVFDENPPAPYVPWPGPPAQPSVNNEWVVDAGDPLPQGASAQLYRYTINIIDDQGQRQTKMIAVENGTPMTVDPGIENQPEP